MAWGWFSASSSDETESVSVDFVETVSEVIKSVANVEQGLVEADRLLAEIESTYSANSSSSSQTSVSSSSSS